MHNEFSTVNLAHLRELAFRTAAWHADHQQVEHLRRHGVAPQWEARPRVMACVAPQPDMERLIRRAAGPAASLDTDFRGVTVRSGETSEESLLERYADLIQQLRGQVVLLDGPEIATALSR